MNKAKSFDIPKSLIWEAYKKVSQNNGAAGVDNVSVQDFEVRLKDNLYKLWNRMSSGSYFPPAVKTVAIPKAGGKERLLGIPTVADRIAQAAAVLYLEPLLEPHFVQDSYGYRPKKSALDAVGEARKRCWKQEWVIDLDIEGFFDNLEHELILKALQKHTACRWILFYVAQWLKSNVQQQDGTLIQRTKGVPQGGVISPLLANLFLHYAFDKWLHKYHPEVSFLRYADDIVVHCQTKAQAEAILEAIKQRLADCGLKVNQQKTHIAYCGLAKRYEHYPIKSFDFLGYTFRRRLVQAANGNRFVGFVPAISHRAKKQIRQTIKHWRLHHKTSETIEMLAKEINPMLRGWINYYGKYYRSEVKKLLLHVEYYLKRWARRKYCRKTSVGGITQALTYLGRVRRYKPYLFEHWRLGCGSPIE